MKISIALKYTAWLVLFALCIITMFQNQSDWFYVMAGVVFFATFTIIDKRLHKFPLKHRHKKR